MLSVCGEPWAAAGGSAVQHGAAGRLAAALLVRIMAGASDMMPPDHAVEHGAAVNEDDQEDIRASLGGDGDAYARLVRRHQADVALRMRRFSRNPQDIEDLVHQVFVQAYWSLGRYRERAPLSHWLARIATRVGYRFWSDRDRRRRLQERAVPPPASAPDAEDAVDAAELVHLLLAQLPPRDRLVLTLLYLEECTVERAAELTGWSRTMVKVQAHRARAKLRRLLESRDAVGG